MPFSHDTVAALDFVVDLVNTSPTRASPDALPDLVSLRRFVSDHEVSEIEGLRVCDLRSVHMLRTRASAVFGAPDVLAASEAINALLAKATVTPRLTDHGGYDWHVHYFGPGSSVGNHLIVDCAMALAHVLVSGELDRLRRCEAPTCHRVLVDLSRNRSKRYCDARTCGNRLHVAAYRERRRAAQA